MPVTRIELGGSNGGIQSEENLSTLLRKMAQPETGGVRTTEDEGDTLETASDDEEIIIPSQERDDLRNVDIRGEQKIHNEKTGYYLRSPGMGLARDKRVRSTLRQRRIQFSGRPSTIHRPTSEWDPPSVARKTD